jgi:Transposase, Mutator family
VKRSEDERFRPTENRNHHTLSPDSAGSNPKSTPINQRSLTGKTEDRCFGCDSKRPKSCPLQRFQEPLKTLTGEGPRRSGYFKRVLDSEHGRIALLSVPKLRHSAGQRDWQILQRYQRGLEHLSNICLCLYVMGLSLRDLQEALYPFLGTVLSVNANQTGTHDDLPPLFNLGIFSHSKISPTQCIFGLLETRLNPRSKPITIPDFSEFDLRSRNHDKGC